MNSKKTYSIYLSDENLFIVCFRCHYFFLVPSFKLLTWNRLFSFQKVLAKIPSHVLEQLGHSVIYQCPSGLYCCAFSISVISLLLIVLLITSMNSLFPLKYTDIVLSFSCPRKKWESLIRLSKYRLQKQSQICSNKMSWSHKGCTCWRA